MASEMCIGVDVASRELVISSAQNLAMTDNTRTAIDAW